MIIFRLERDHAVFFVEPFERRLAVDHGADDLAVFRRALLLDDHPVAVQDAGADHAVALDLQGEKLAAAHVAGNRQQPFDIFFAEKRLTGGHPAKQRDIPGSAQNRFAQGIDDFEGALADSADVAFFLQSFQMIGDAVGRSDFELLADLGDRRREAAFANGFQQKVLNRFLSVRQRRQHEPCILKIISVVNSAAKKPRVQAVQNVPTVQVVVGWQNNF